MSTVEASKDATGAAPDPDALRRFLDGEHREVRERVRELISRPEFAPPRGVSREEHRELVMKRMCRLAEEGGTSLGFPIQYGGMGNIGASISGFETLGLGDLSLLVKCGVQFGLFGGAILHLGTERHHEKYLPQVISTELPGCFAMTETGHGSNVQEVGTTATYDPDTGEFVVKTPDEESRKDYIGNAAMHGRMAAVFAQLIVGEEKHGVHCLLVPLRDDDGNVLPGIRIEDCGEKLGLEGVDNGRIWFDDVRVPRENLLNKYADVDESGTYVSPIENPNRRFFTMLGTLIQGRVSVGGASLSASKLALTTAIRYGLKRRQFGPPGGDGEALLMDYRVHQRRLMPLLAKTYALHFAQEQLVAELHRVFSTDAADRDRRKLEGFAAGVKAIATWHATDTIQTCREACGGAGYMAENRFASLKADTDVFTTFEGDNTVLLQLVAKGLLTDYSARFGDLSQLEMVRFVGAQVFETVVERSLARQLVGAVLDAVPSSDEEPVIEDREFQLQLFRGREEHVLGGVARRLKRGIDDGQDSFTVFNECQDHVLEAARAHVDRIVFEAFIGAVERAEDGPVKEALSKLCDLYALWTIEQERGWYFEHSRMTAPQSKAITRHVNRLCGELRENALALVDAFGIPEELLGPIAK
ncbi:MAG TPA: acyl-CoA dehydrogenase [Gemmatimonadaceae bacterium]|nr:acyl-CoA dehydrogenase [Gemmatimonadaceae bacterium]